MAFRNRVTPTGEIVAIDQRGLFMGNRGSIHRAPGEIARPWQVRRWITCQLEYKGWVAPKWVPGRWTPLFFWDEAVALAAGHRPCALCRRPDFNAWLDAWSAAFGTRPRVDPMDHQLHADRLTPSRTQRHHPRPWKTLPTGTFVAVATPGSPALAPGDESSSPGAGGHSSPDLGDRLSPDLGDRLSPDLGGRLSPDLGGRFSAGSSGSGPRAGAIPALVLDDRLVPWSPAGYGPAVERPSEGTAVVLTPKATVEVLGHGYSALIHPTATDPDGADR